MYVVVSGPRQRRRWSYRKAYITIAIRLRYDYRLRRKIDMFIFARVESRRMEAGARNTS